MEANATELERTMWRIARGNGLAWACQQDNPERGIIFVAGLRGIGAQVLRWAGCSACGTDNVDIL